MSTDIHWDYNRPSLDGVGPSRFFRCDKCRAKAAWIEPTPLAYALLCERCGRGLAALTTHKQKAARP
jgi:hypothetical protein